MFESLRVETSLGLSSKVGKEQHRADNKFFGSGLQSFIFIMFGSGGSGNPSWLCDLCGSGVLYCLLYKHVIIEKQGE